MLQNMLSELIINDLEMPYFKLKDDEFENARRYQNIARIY